MKLKSVSFTLLFIFLSLNSFSQFKPNVVDSLSALANSKDKKVRVDALINLTRLVWEFDLDSSFYYAQQALQVAIKSNDTKLLGDAYNNQGNAYLMNRRSEEALPWYEKALELRRKTGNQDGVIGTLHNFGVVYQQMNKYSESINSFKEAADVSEATKDFQSQAYMLMMVASNYKQINDNNKALEYAIQAASIFLQLDIKPGVGYSYNFIGSLHKDLNNSHLALEYYLKAYEIYEGLGDIKGLITSYNNLGIAYIDLNDDAKALEFYTKSLELSKSTQDQEGQAIAYNNIGHLRSKMRNFTEALVSYEKSIEISQKISDFPSIMNTYNNIAWVYFHSGNIAKAKDFVLKALTYSNKTPNLFYSAESHEILSKIYSSNGEYKKGFYHLSQLLSIKDSLFKSSSNEKYMEMQVRFETERKEKEIELLIKNDEIKNLQLQRQNTFNIYWAIITAIFVASGIFITFNLRAKQKVNKLLIQNNIQLEETNLKLTQSEQHLKELNVTKDRFFSLIAHDLKNPFNALLGFSELLNSNYGNYSEAESKELIKIIYDSSQNLYKLLDNLLQWSRSQLGNIMFSPELFPLLSVVDEELDLLRPVANQKELNLSVQIEEYLLVLADKNLVGVIVRNLVSNAIKFSNPHDQIIIAAMEQDNLVVISVADTGIGIDKDNLDKLFRLDSNFTSKGTADEKGTGLGLILCKEFVEKNGGTIWVESNKDKGSIFYFTLPSIRSSRNNPEKLVSTNS